MSAVIAYPATLPAPQPGSFEPHGRRAGSSLEGALQQRARQRDRSGATAAYQWTYTPAELKTWLQWYRFVLLDGRRWALIPLPGVDGLQLRVARYLQVRQSLLGAGIYRVDAQLELRSGTLSLGLYYVSPPYPVVTSEFLDVAHALEGGQLYTWLPGNVDVSHAMTGGTLNQLLSTYSNWPAENVDVTHALTAGVLTLVLQRYDLWPTENVDVTHAVTAGLLTTVLLTYANWPAENVDVAHAITGGTLT